MPDVRAQLKCSWHRVGVPPLSVCSSAPRRWAFTAPPDPFSILGLPFLKVLGLATLSTLPPSRSNYQHLLCVASCSLLVPAPPARESAACQQLAPPAQPAVQRCALQSSFICTSTNHFLFQGLLPQPPATCQPPSVPLAVPIPDVGPLESTSLSYS